MNTDELVGRHHQNKYGYSGLWFVIALWCDGALNAGPAVIVCSTDHTCIWCYHPVRTLLYGLQKKVAPPGGATWCHR